MNVWYDKPVAVPGAFVAIGGESQGRWFLIGNDQQARDDTFSVWQFFDHRQALTRTFQMPFESAHVEITIPFAGTGLQSPLFSMNTIAHTSRDPRDIASNGFDIFSAVDKQIVNTPEPSSVALASFGVVAFVAHLWLPRLRQRRGERHRRIEPIPRWDWRNCCSRLSAYRPFRGHRTTLGARRSYPSTRRARPYRRTSDSWTTLCGWQDKPPSRWTAGRVLHRQTATRRSPR